MFRGPTSTWWKFLEPTKHVHLRCSPKRIYHHYWPRLLFCFPDEKTPVGRKRRNRRPPPPQKKNFPATDSGFDGASLAEGFGGSEPVKASGSMGVGSPRYFIRWNSRKEMVSPQCEEPVCVFFEARYPLLVVSRGERKAPTFEGPLYFETNPG